MAFTKSIIALVFLLSLIFSTTYGAPASHPTLTITATATSTASPNPSNHIVARAVSATIVSTYSPLSSSSSSPTTYTRFSASNPSDTSQSTSTGYVATISSEWSQSSSSESWPSHTPHTRYTSSHWTRSGPPTVTVSPTPEPTTFFSGVTLTASWSWALPTTTPPIKNLSTIMDECDETGFRFIATEESKKINKAINALGATKFYPSECHEYAFIGNCVATKDDPCVLLWQVFDDPAMQELTKEGNKRKSEMEFMVDQAPRSQMEASERDSIKKGQDDKYMLDKKLGIAIPPATIVPASVAVGWVYYRRSQEAFATWLKRILMEKGIKNLGVPGSDAGDYQTVFDHLSEGFLRPVGVEGMTDVHNMLTLFAPPIDPNKVYHPGTPPHDTAALQPGFTFETVWGTSPMYQRFTWFNTLSPRGGQGRFSLDGEDLNKTIPDPAPSLFGSISGDQLPLCNSSQEAWTSDSDSLPTDEEIARCEVLVTRIRARTEWEDQEQRFQAEEKKHPEEEAQPPQDHPPGDGDDYPGGPPMNPRHEADVRRVWTEYTNEYKYCAVMTDPNFRLTNDGGPRCPLPEPPIEKPHCCVYLLLLDPLSVGWDTRPCVACGA